MIRDNAIVYYQKVLDDYPQSSYVNSALAGIGLMYFNKKEDDKAFGYFDQIVKKDPKSTESKEVLETIKKIFDAKGDVDGKEKYFASIG
jgi:outer membrane protein assembly factor BamD (BamD/ComL family)